MQLEKRMSEKKEKKKSNYLHVSETTSRDSAHYDDRSNSALARKKRTLQMAKKPS